MAIGISRYVDITSGVGAGTTVNTRELIGRIFSSSSLLPPGGETIEFTTAAAVRSYFGSSSIEAARASFYFSWISKNITRPKKLGFSRWVDADVAPKIFGNQQPQSIPSWQLINAGSFRLTIGTEQGIFTGLDFSGISGMADAALVVQNAIRAWPVVTKTGTTTSGSPTVTISPDTTEIVVGQTVTGTGIPNGTTVSAINTGTEITLSANATATGTTSVGFVEPMWGLAEVFWNSALGRFEFTGGVAGAVTISVQTGNAGVSISAKLGWIYDPALSPTNTLIITNGADEQTVVEAVTLSANTSTNFGSFLFQDSLTLEQLEELGQWNTEQNVLYMFMVPVLMANIDSYFIALNAFSGVAITLSESDTLFDEMIPMMILAATDYTAANSVQNYMFQTFGLVPEVTTDEVADTLDVLRINYYGRTQTAGQFLDFYQRGVLMGLPNAPLDMNTYANEQWLKDAATAAIMTLLLALSKVSANVQGRSQILTILQQVINQALNNGTISVGKRLTTSQILYITEITNDANAWYQVQNIGYWVDCVIEITADGYVANYILVYSKDDVIRKVNGQHVLI